jgi:hypothetical protein
MKRIVRLVFNRILINVTDIFLRVIGINRIDPLIRKLVESPPPPPYQQQLAANAQTWMRDRSPAGNVLLSPHNHWNSYTITLVHSVTAAD